ncbi:MAG: hypothetical protein ACRYG6_07615 [Janthinobacterium lividum]
MSPDTLTEPPPGLSLADMAARLEVSRETLRGWLRKWPDFPVLAHGTHGQRYQFDPDAVVAFVRLRRQPPRGASLDLSGGADSEAPRALRDQLDAAKLELLRRQNQRLARRELAARRELVSAAAVREALLVVLQHLGEAMRAGLAASCRELNLPEAVAQALWEGVNEALRDFIRTLPVLLRGGYLQDDNLIGPPDP